MDFIDTHVHFHFPDYDEDRKATIDRARQAGMVQCINVGTDVPSSQESLKIALQYDFIFASAGIHPHDAAKADEQAFRDLEAILKEKKVVAIGEVGLDFFREHSPREIQKEVFCRFLTLQKSVQKPLIIHCRDAYEDLREILREFGDKSFQGVMHCFSSDEETMVRFLDLGFYISFAGPLTYKKNDALRAACKACPKDRLVFETDAPFLTPQTYRGKRNESSYLVETMKTASEIRGESLEKLGEQTTRNARKLFNL